MSDQLVEISLCVLLAFFIGAIVGCLLKMAFGSSPAPAMAPSMPKSPPPPSPPSPPKVARVATAAVSATAVLRPSPSEAPPPPAKPSRPPKIQVTVNAEDQLKGIPAPRGGKPDALKRISGIGPKLERALHKLGTFHYDQIAAWSPSDVEWVENHLKFKGRIERERWQDQARLLADKNEAEFSKLYGSQEDSAKKSSRKKPQTSKTPAPEKDDIPASQKETAPTLQKDASPAPQDDAAPSSAGEAEKPASENS